MACLGFEGSLCLIQRETIQPKAANLDVAPLDVEDTGVFVSDGFESTH